MRFPSKSSRAFSEAGQRVAVNDPRGSMYTTIMELGPKRPSLLWFWGPNSKIVVFMDPLGIMSWFTSEQPYLQQCSCGNCWSRLSTADEGGEGFHFQALGV